MSLPFLPAGAKNKPDKHPPDRQRGNNGNPSQLIHACQNRRPPEIRLLAQSVQFEIQLVKKRENFLSIISGCFIKIRDSPHVFYHLLPGMTDSGHVPFQICQFVFRASESAPDVLQRGILRAFLLLQNMFDLVTSQIRRSQERGERIPHSVKAGLHFLRLTRDGIGILIELGCRIAYFIHRKTYKQNIAKGHKTQQEHPALSVMGMSASSALCFLLHVMFCAINFH